MNTSEKGQYDYRFDDLELIKNHSIFVSGEALIDYEYDPDDPDVGYRGGFSISVEAIVINSTKKEVGPLNLNNADPIYDMIEKALMRKDWRIVEEIEEYASSLGRED